jgi:hypothetical protein
MPSVLDAARRPLLDAAPDLAGALVYLDSGAAEVVRMSLGVELLYGERTAGGAAEQAVCCMDRHCMCVVYGERQRGVGAASGVLYG